MFGFLKRKPAPTHPAIQDPRSSKELAEQLRKNAEQIDIEDRMIAAVAKLGGKLERGMLLFDANREIVKALEKGAEIYESSGQKSKRSRKH